MAFPLAQIILLHQFVTFSGKEMEQGLQKCPDKLAFRSLKWSNLKFSYSSPILKKNGYHGGNGSPTDSNNFVTLISHFHMIVGGPRIQKMPIHCKFQKPKGVNFELLLDLFQPDF